LPPRQFGRWFDTTLEPLASIRAACLAARALEEKPAAASILVRQEAAADRRTPGGAAYDHLALVELHSPHEGIGIAQDRSHRLDPARG
jgi:hypothetical protein